MNRVAASIASVVSIAVLVGCGGTDDATSTDESQKDPASSSGELTKDDFIDRMSSALDGAESAHATMSVVSSEQTLTAEGDMIFGDSAAESAMDFDYESSGSTFQLRVVDSLVYVNFGPGTDNKFFTIDPAEADNPLAKEFSGLLEQMDPATSFEPMKKGIRSVRQRAGSPRISGVRTIPYEVVVETRKIVDMPGLEGVPLSQLPSTFTYVFYIDEDDLVRKITFEIEDTKMLMTYTDYGKPVEITAPPASEITTKFPFNSAI